MVYYVLALALFPQQGYDEVMRLLTQGLSWLSGWSREWEVPSVPAIAKARARLGEQPLALL
jgi:Insertion element 4 transposase N-terminal